MSHMKISQENFVTAWENQRLVHGALKKAHVRMDYDHYDDFFQNGVIIYAQMLEQYCDKPREEVDKLSFNKIYWKTLNELHKVQLNCERDAEMEEAAGISEDKLDWNELLVLKNELQQMSELERKLLIEHIGYQRRIVDLCRDNDVAVARVTLQRMKKRLLMRLRDKMR